MAKGQNGVEVMNMKDLVLVKMDMLHYVHDMRAVKGVGLSLQKRKEG